MRPVLTLLTALLAASAVAEAPRPLRIDDIYELQRVSDPQLSPDGALVAWVQTRLDRERDEKESDIWMMRLDGGEPIRVTSAKGADTRPRFSPDGRYLAFLSKRTGKKQQVWLLDRRGGEPFALTDYKASVSDLAWSPDGRRLALVVSDPDPNDPDLKEGCDGDEPKRACTAPPIVIRRQQFKRDGEGYLTELRSHLHVFDVAARSSVQVTTGPYDDGSPTWSPDGRYLAFVANRTEDPDRNKNTDVFVVEPRAGAEARRLVTLPGTDEAPSWAPDSKSLVFVAGGDPSDMWYGTSHVATVALADGAVTHLTRELDRNVLDPRHSRDGRHVLFVVEEDGARRLARVPVKGGPIERIVGGRRVVSDYAVGPEIVVLEGTPERPFELSVVCAAPARAAGCTDGLRRLTRVNDAFLAGIRLGPVERFRSKTPDGTEVDGFLVRPPDAPAGQRLPTILDIHGGPVDQFAHEFMEDWQLMAAHGYAVVGVNPRGSSGRGRDYARAIWADWGNKDFDDVMAAVDHVIAMGVADPDRLGVGGWSYGGMLTDYVITKTGRFRGAVSGASETNYLANYGTDHYQHEWEAEMGLPWENTAEWIRISPWFQVAKVTTPTLVMCGQDDVNVPLLNSEQLYQALRRLGVPTELVIYPGEDHSIDRPSYQEDRYRRWIGWFDRWVKTGGSSGQAE